MADATKFPTLSELTYFQWSTPAAGNPRLSAPIDSDDTTIAFTSAPLDEDGNVITAPFIMGVKNDDSYVESIYCPNGADGASGLSATGCVRGIDLAGKDFTVGDTDNAASHEQDSPVSCNITAVLNQLIVEALQGNLATGGAGFTIGTDALGTVTIYRSSGTGSKLGVFRWENGGGKAQFSNDGAVWNDIDNVTSGSLAVVTGADTTPGNLDTKITVDADTMTKTVTSPGGDERLELAAVGGLADIVDDVTTTASELNQLDGISANVTDTNLNTLTAGSSSDADALHSHNQSSISRTAGENIDGSTNALPLGMSVGGLDTVMITKNNTFGNEAGGGVTYVSWGNTDATWKEAQSFTYTNPYASDIRITKIIVCMRKVASPTDNITIEIQGDDTNKPDKSTITNGTSANFTGSSLASAANRYNWAEFTFGTDPSITSGTKYWITLNRVDAPDAVNYYDIVSYASDVYSSHGNSSYTLSSGVWAAESSTDYAIYVELEIDGDTKVYPLDADNKNILNYVGWTKDNVVTDASLDVIYQGEIDTLTGLTEGREVYSSTTAGDYSHTPPNSDSAARIDLGSATSATSLLINRGNIAMGDNSTGTLGGVDAGADALATGPAVSGTLDVFVKTGFRPSKVEALGRARITAAATYDGIAFDSNESAGLQDRRQDLNNSSQYVTTSSSWSGSAGTDLAIGAFEDNGFHVTATAKNIGQTGDAEVFGWIAT